MTTTIKQHINSLPLDERADFVKDYNELQTELKQLNNMINEKTMLPAEISDLAVKVSASKQQEISTVLNQIFAGTDEWEKQVDSIEVKGIDDTMSIQLAEVARKNSKSARLAGEKIIDAKREEVQQLKAEFDLEDKLWLKTKQIMQLKFKAIEEKAEWKANFVKRYEAEQKELRTQNRILEVQKYADLNRIEFENMSDDSFNSFIGGLKAQYEAKIEAERLAEEKRIEEARKEAERIEQQRLENEMLKKEAAEKEKQLEAERKKAADEKAKIEAQAAKEKALADKKLAEERAEKEKLEQELRQKAAKEEADRKEKEAAELAAKKEEEKLAKAPLKKQLKVWVESFNIPNAPTENEKAKDIISKFEAFKKWAESQIELI